MTDEKKQLWCAYENGSGVEVGVFQTAYGAR